MTIRIATRPLVAALILTAALLSSLAFGASPGDDLGRACTISDEPLVLGPDIEPVACGVAYRLLLGIETGPEAAVSRLEIDLLARPIDRSSGRPRLGSYVPHLRPRFLLRSGERVLAEGRLDLRLSAQGPSWGSRTPLPDDLPMDAELSLWIEPGLVASFAPANVEPRAPRGASDAVGPSLRMDQVATLSPRPAGDYNDIWGWNDGSVYLAILGSDNGTSFIDISDPANPVEVGYITGPNSSWRDIKTYQNYAYIVTEGSGSGEGLQIVDLSDPLAPVLANTYTATFTTAHNLWIDEPAGRLYAIGTSNGVRILDIASDPVNPVEIGSWTERSVHDAYVADGRAFFAEINAGLHEILDATDPANLQVLASWPTPGGSTHNSFANRDQSLTVTTDEVTGGIANVYDTSSLAGEIPRLGGYDPDPTTIVHNVLIDDEDDALVVISHYGIGVHLVDIHRPSAPLRLGFFDTYGDGDTGFVGCWGVYPFDPRGLILASDISSGLFVLQYAPTGGNVSGVVRDAASGTPIAGATVTVLADGTRTRSGADGVFAVYAPAGEIQLRVTAPGYGSRLLRAGTLIAGERLDADAELSPLPVASVSGSVVRDDDSTPIAGAAVEVPALGVATTTDASGEFTLTGVAVGGHVVTARAFGFSDGETRILLGTTGVADVVLRLEPAAFVDDVESDRGWTLGVPGDGATSGQWVQVDPNGTAGGTIQPEDDHTPDPGIVAFITGQQSPGQASEANDVDGGSTTLVTPTLAGASLGAAQVRYHRWVAVEGGFLSGGGTLRVELSSDDGTSWVGVEQVSDHENRWTSRRVDVASITPLSDALRLRFVAEPNSPYNFRVLECGVDDVELVRACRARFNPDQPDGDGDGEVDPCDACAADPLDDADADGLCGDVDNAPLIANADQADGDGDGIGDAADLCPTTPDPAQRDLDRDGLGDACDSDLDGDGLDNGSDPDRDGDQVADTDDLCPTVPDARQLDDDGDGQGNACDEDDLLVAAVRLEGSRLHWEPESGALGYNVYRGDLGAQELLHLAACLRESMATTYATDEDVPTPGDGYFYLLTASSSGGEGGLGRRSDGSERQIDQRCP